MKNSGKVLSTGARDSKLSIAQSTQALEKLRELFPVLEFDLIPMSSPGDRDRETDLRVSKPDFFTRDLDEAILKEKLDCALHSAKDLSEKLCDGLDFFWLPWREDPRDAVVLRAGENMPSAPVIGVSSERREAWCRKNYPDSILKSVRGNIDSRIEQLDNGDFDALIMAAAGLNRLGLQDRISEYISPVELTPPSAQAYLALTFKKKNPVFNAMRQLFVKPVIIAGAGVGSSDNTPLGTIDALKRCDICLYDALCPLELLDFLPAGAKTIYSGKRNSHQHSIRQSEICELMINYAKQGKAVVRLKGGDPGIFGRLAEETDALIGEELPFRILPGVSSMSVASAASGLPLTGRGLARGFTVCTPRRASSGRIEYPGQKERENFPEIFYMASKALGKLSQQMLAAGHSPAAPATVIYDAGSDESFMICCTLENIADKLPDITLPGLVFVGANADEKFIYPNNGVLKGMKVLFAGSEELADSARHYIYDFSGSPVMRPMLRLAMNPAGDKLFQELEEFDWLIIPSPGAARLFFEAAFNNAYDLRKIPKIAVSGPHTGMKCAEYGIIPEITPDAGFGRDGLSKALETELRGTERIIRLKSNIAGTELRELLDVKAHEFIDWDFYSNSEIKYSGLPEFTAVIFTSPSSVRAFVNNFSKQALKGKTACVIGGPTRKQLEKIDCGCKIIQGSEATMENMLFALAADKANKTIQGKYE